MFAYQWNLHNNVIQCFSVFLPVTSNLLDVWTLTFVISVCSSASTRGYNRGIFLNIFLISFSTNERDLRFIEKTVYSFWCHGVVRICAFERCKKSSSLCICCFSQTLLLLFRIKFFFFVNLRFLKTSFCVVRL